MSRKKDIYYLKEAFRTARDLSQDPNTQTGAVILNTEGDIISRGANRLHLKLRDKYSLNLPKEIIERPAKYLNLIHAERDAIFNANRKGKSLVGCTIYTTWSPCYFCAEVVINNGISRVVTHQSTIDWYKEVRKNTYERYDWNKSNEKGLNALKDNNVKYECLTEPIKDVEILFDDKKQSPDKI